MPQSIRIAFDPEVVSGFDVLKVTDLAMAFDHPLFDGISFEIKRGDKAALLGPNGIGKTTMFHLILHDYTPTHGKIKIGVKVMIGYYDQEQTSLDMSKTIFDEISDTYPRMTNTEIRNICATFLFKGEDVFKTIGDLSGGEKGRVILIKLLLNKANFLILDEPTNHLDIQSEEVLEDALLDFPGTILFISHDRYFINKIATKVIEMTPHGAHTYEGDYDYYMAHKHPIIEEKKDKPVTITKREIDRKTKNRIKKLEEEISALEDTISEKEASLNEEEIINDYEKYNALNDEIEKLNTQLEALMEEWENLQE